MKKLFIITLLVVFTVSIAGCGSGNPYDQGFAIGKKYSEAKAAKDKDAEKAAFKEYMDYLKAHKGQKDTITKFVQGYVKATKDLAPANLMKKNK